METPFPPPNPDTRLSNAVREILELPENPGEVALSGFFEKDDHGTPYRTEKVAIASMAQALEAEGDPVNSFYLERFTDRRFLEGLTVAAERTDTDVLNYVRHSNRYSMIDRFTVHDREHSVTIPMSADNLHASGKQRREETHDGFDMESVLAQGIDPNYVLYFRATRPSMSPKPEYYWTSDLWEVNYSLGGEGSNRAGDSIILVSTLAQIAENGGLMIDVNDDNGIAVRQVGLAPYDQKDALFSYSLYNYISPVKEG